MRHLRFAALLGLLLTPLLTYLWVGKEGAVSFPVIFWCWVALFLVSLGLKLLTAGIEKGKHKLRQKKDTVDDPHQVTSEKNFLQEVVDLVWVGDYIGMAISLLPGLLFVAVWDNYIPLTLPDRIKAGLFGSLIIAWLFLLEKKLNLTLVLPVFPIPLKWLMIGATLFFVIWGNPA
jgi:hypothetical protein